MTERIKKFVKRRLASHPRLYALAARCYFKLRVLGNRLPGEARGSYLRVSKEDGLSKVGKRGVLGKGSGAGESVCPFDAEYQDEQDFSTHETDLKAIAYYLPQFHQIEENDEWWGPGFTEWTNTRSAEPLFEGHYQPRQPHDDIGYYDLSDVNVMKDQVAMAKRHGIYGFCFYHYWFHGKRLLDKPLDMLMEHPEIDMPFCLCWANETWSKKWDGRDHHILMEQTFSDEDDINFIESLSKYMADDRYIRIDSKPVVLVYRIHKLPDINATVKRWRDWCRDNGVGEICLLAVFHGEVGQETLGPPEEYGFDAYASFPPHNFICSQSSTEGDDLKNTRICDYQNGVERYACDHDVKIYEGCMLGWDNTARLGSRAYMFLRFSLDAYYRWLCKVIEYTRKTFRQDERFFFINAWNEWAEGAYLEPDKKYGYAYLNTTSRALFGLPLTEGVVLNDASGSLGEMSAAKYDQNYDWVKTQIVAGGDYSLAKMDHYITSGSEILEFGSASGYFTRYLKEEKKAIVDIAEIDPDCAAQAARHARDCVVGDIEQHLWAQEYAGRKYDYILFADVLEHLRDPWFMLESVKPFLADDGQILISLPNIAHKEIIAALYNNDFSYANVGIMDKTHLRFFTERTVRELISQSGLHLREMQYVNAPVLPEGCGTRLNKTQVPRELQAFLSKKQHANVIQFVASCRKTPS